MGIGGCIVRCSMEELFVSSVVASGHLGASGWKEALVVDAAGVVVEFSG